MKIRVGFIFFWGVSLFAQSDLWISSQAGNGSNIVFINAGDGNLTNSQQSLGNSLSLACAYGDLDGDGDIDLVDAADPGCWVYLNDGQGNLAIDSGFGADFPITRSVALADLDNDSDLDVILGVANSQFTSASQVFLNDGGAQFSFLGEIGSQNTRSHWGCQSQQRRLPRHL